MMLVMPMKTSFVDLLRVKRRGKTYDYRFDFVGALWFVDDTLGLRQKLVSLWKNIASDSK